MKLNKKAHNIFADEFIKLHRDKEILLLPYVWNVASARIFEKSGFRAVGTKSAYFETSPGYSEEQIANKPVDFKEIKKIIENTNLLVCVDIESGNQQGVDCVVEAASAVLEAGGVGINLKDEISNEEKSFIEIYDMVQKINAIRKMTEKEGIHLLINICIHFLNNDREKISEKIRYTVERAKIYVESGADCITIPIMDDSNEQIITNLIKRINAPVRIITGGNIPSVNKLEEIGVACLSFPAKLYEGKLRQLAKMSKELEQIDSMPVQNHN